MGTGKLNGVVRHLRRAALVRDGGGMTEGHLLECFVTRRDEAAFEALVRRHGPMVLGVCRRVLRNTHDADDAFQATFLVLVRKATSIGQRELVGNWLYGTAYRAALEVKAAKRRVKERQVSAMPEPVAVDEADVWRDLRLVLDQELNRLPEKYRVPVVLCDLEGRTRRDVARQLGIPEGTLSGQLTTARRMLAKRLGRHGLTLAVGSLAAMLSQNAASACVPVPLVVSTIKAASLFAAGQAATVGLASANVAAITEGVLKAMLMTNLKVTATVLLVIGGAVMSGGAMMHHSLADTRADRPAVAAEQPRTPQAEDRLEPPDREAQQPRGQPKGEATVSGTLQGVDVAKNTVTVTTSNRQTGKTDKTFELAKDVVVLRDGKPSKVSDLKQGGRITVKLSPDQKTAVSISETGKTMVAPLKSIDPEKSSITLTVTTGGRNAPEKKDVTHELAKDGKVTLEGKEVKLADLKDVRPGSTIRLTFSVDDEKKLVHIQYAARNR